MSFPSGFVPVLPLKNTVLYPGVSQALRVGREKSLKALQHAFQNNNWILTFSQIDQNQNVEKESDLHSIGTLVRIESVRGNPESGYHIVVKGVDRVRRLSWKNTQGYIEAEYEKLEELKNLEPTLEKALLKSLRELSIETLKLFAPQADVVIDAVEGIDDLQDLGYFVSAHADFPINEKQSILENSYLKERSMQILNLLQTLKESLSVQADIRQKLNNKFGQSQRQQILREQLKTIKEELGEGVEGKAHEQYKKKLEALELPEDALELANAQMKRLEELTASSPEYHVVKNHLDFLTSLPWNKTSGSDEIDLNEAQKILDEDHNGLDLIKKRILQHLAVYRLTKGKKGSILLFLGPPGVGKTSLGQSIARALGRKYVRASLGGVRDDAEIRGHRRTYIGALPGRILSSLKKAGEKDPVFILDEIDKMSRGFTGDPASSMLEVLDPEQNTTFMDHYLDVPFDLSQVFFIGTANSLEGIPAPLLDRMEVIELGSYTSNEKLAIAKQHLLEKQMQEHGLKSDQLKIDDDVLATVIAKYTREAGVRELQRKIAEICRWASSSIVKGEVIPIHVTLANLEEIFGQEKFSFEKVRAQSMPGVVAGLAWTPVGGDLLYIESALMPGKGNLTLTGQLGDVMKESASIALSLLKSRMAFFNPGFDFSKYDFHLHAPAGATPKDGPSAGVTLLTSLASLLTGRSVTIDMAMTGEITLAGSVLPVGGVKEKLMAAHRGGIRKVLIPKYNEKDLKTLPEEVRKDLEVHAVEHVNEVLKWALDLEFPNQETPALNPPFQPHMPVDN
jgi:ATP-dependent Lon protease